MLEYARFVVCNFCLGQSDQSRTTWYWLRYASANSTWLTMLEHARFVACNFCLGHGDQSRTTWYEYCERWCVTKFCVKDGVCDRVLCERWYVTRMVCERWCVTKMVRESCVWQRWCVKDGVCERWCVATKSQHDAISATPATQKRKWMWPSATPATRNEGGCCQVPKWKWPSATPATQSWAASPATKRAPARHQSQPMSISATPATQNEGECDQVPHLPRDSKVDVAKCQRGSDQVPRLPRRTQVDVAKWHTCHAKRRWMSPSAMPATQSWAASPATKRAPARPSAGAPKRATRASPVP